jgi:uncharacterized membrane protein
MLTPEEVKFVQYWREQRQNKKAFLRKFSVVLPVISLVAVLFFANFLSGWYGKADRILHRYSSMFLVILVAIVAIIVFVAVFSVHHKWEQNESEYLSLLKKQEQQQEP